MSAITPTSVEKVWQGKAGTESVAVCVGMAVMERYLILQQPGLKGRAPATSGSTVDRRVQGAAARPTPARENQEHQELATSHRTAQTRHFPSLQACWHFDMKRSASRVMLRPQTANLDITMPRDDDDANCTAANICSWPVGQLRLSSVWLLRMNNKRHANSRAAVGSCTHSESWCCQSSRSMHYQLRCPFASLHRAFRALLQKTTLNKRPNTTIGLQATAF
eukprot:357987-Chlamydomonas_euryale.AAC.2